MMPDQLAEQEKRIALAVSRTSLGLTRWEKLTRDEKHEIVELMKEGLSDKELFAAYMEIRHRKPEEVTI